MKTTGGQRFKTNTVKVFVLISLYSLLTGVFYFLYPVRHHWSEIFRPAALALISGISPYDGIAFYNPPWALAPIVPFALLPERFGNALYASLSLFGFGIAAVRMGARFPTLSIFLLLPMTLYNGLQVNVDWLVALGFLMPPQVGLFFILVKPQAGAFLALFWLIEAWRDGGITRVARIFGPVSLAFLISFGIYGLYLTKSQFMIGYEGKQLWPYSIPIGLAFFVYAVKSRKRDLSIACAPLLTPYFQPYTLPLAILGIINNPTIAIPSIIGLWVITFSENHLYLIRAILHF